MRAIIAISFFYASCSSSLWQSQGIPAADAHFASLRLSYPVAPSGCRLELFRTEEGVEALLSATSGPFLQTTVEVSLSLEGEEPLEIPISVMEGSMRLRLPPVMVDFLVEALAADRSVTLELQGRKTMIDAKGFRPLWEKKGEFLFRLRQ